MEILIPVEFQRALLGEGGGVAVPTASGSFDEWYQCWLSDKEIEKVQAAA